MGAVVRGGSTLHLRTAEITATGALLFDEKSQGTLSHVRLRAAAGNQGIALAGGSKAVLESSALLDCGALVGAETELVARDSEFTGSDTDGVRIVNGGALTAVGCRVTGARGHGLNVQASSRAELTNCTVFDNAGDGIRCNTDEPVTVHDCEVRDNGGRAVHQLKSGGSLSVERLDTGGRQDDTDGAVGSGVVAGDGADWSAAGAHHTGTGPLAELEALVGLESVKSEVTGLINLIRMSQRRQETGPAHAADEPPPRLRRSAGHRQDDRRPALRHRARGTRRPQPGPHDRGGPGRPGGPVHRRHRHQDHRAGHQGARRGPVHRRGVHADRRHRRLRSRLRSGGDRRP